MRERGIDAKGGGRQEALISCGLARSCSYQLLLALGPNVRVLAPAHAAAHLRGLLEEAWKRYEG